MNTQLLWSGEQKILGVCWSAEKDRLVFNISDIATLARNMELTKRNIISVVGRFYDLLGYLAPAVVCFKILLQHL